MGLFTSRLQVYFYSFSQFLESLKPISLINLYISCFIIKILYDIVGVRGVFFYLVTKHVGIALVLFQRFEQRDQLYATECAVYFF